MEGLGTLAVFQENELPYQANGSSCLEMLETAGKVPAKWGLIHKGTELGRDKTPGQD